MPANARSPRVTDHTWRARALAASRSPFHTYAPHATWAASRREAAMQHAWHGIARTWGRLRGKRRWRRGGFCLAQEAPKRPSPSRARRREAKFAAGPGRQRAGGEQLQPAGVAWGCCHCRAGRCRACSAVQCSRCLGDWSGSQICTFSLGRCSLQLKHGLQLLRGFRSKRRGYLETQGKDGC